jgi:hypothetical protein
MQYACRAYYSTHQEMKDQRPRIRGQNTELPFDDLHYNQ